jgi:ElaB/YqjD/DUF883 family membrane-anchored ribosome-binding protein
MSTRTAKAKADAASTVHNLKALRRDDKDALASSGGATAEKLGALRERICTALEDTQNFYYSARDSAKQQMDRCDHYVHVHPYQAAGIAAVIGALAGLLLARRRT